MRFFTEAKTYPIILSIDEVAELQKTGLYPELSDYYIKYLNSMKDKYKVLQYNSWPIMLMVTKNGRVSDTEVMSEINNSIQAILENYGTSLNNYSEEQLAEMIRGMVSLSNIKYIKTKGAKTTLALKDRESNYVHEGPKINTNVCFEKF